MKALQFLVSLAVFLVPAVIALFASRQLSRRSSDEWQLLAFLPPAPLVIWGIYIAIQITRDPSSHNLWPFELVAWTTVTLVLFGAFLLGRKLLVSKPRPWQR